MAGYIRQDTTNNIANGNIINANDLDNEYDAIAAAFGAITGHKHDGTDAEGAPITKVGPVQDVVVSSTAVTPKTDNTVDLGSSSNEFKDLYIDGVANIDSLVADTADINGGTIDGASVGATTPSTGAFTSLTSSSTTTLNGTSIPSSKTLVDTDSAQTLTNKTLTGPSVSGAVVTDGTANGVLYLNGSKAVSSGSGLVFDGANLGLGVTPSAWSSGGNAQFQKLTFAGSDYSLGSNYYQTAGSVYRYASNDTAAKLSFYNGQFLFYTAPSGTAGTAISFTQAMTLDASGNLLVGATSVLDGAKLAVDGGGVVVRNSTVRTFLSPDGGVGGVGTLSNHDFRILTNNNERARIDSSGNLLVGTTSTNITSGGIYLVPGANSEVGVGHASGAGTGSTFTAFRYANTNIGSITQNGTTAVSYNTSSDYRLKHDIAPMQNALQRVAALKPVTYKWNADNSDGEGFIAHELAEVCPQAVTGEKDAVDADGKPVYQGIDTSFLVATLTAAIQEQQKMIEEQRGVIASLTTRIEALEAK